LANNRSIEVSFIPLLQLFVPWQRKHRICQKKYELKSLKVIGSVGEPINEEAWHWYNDHVGAKRCPVVDTWWQTETGGIMISPIAL
jgi:acyl-coenzyme A synthetase/AMP-(fatty) acid ligase